MAESIAFIGFGEAGRTIGRGLIAQLLAIVFLSGCVAPNRSEDLNDITAAKRAEIDAMPEVEEKELSGKPYESLGKVEALTCKRSPWGPAPSWEETVRRTKFEAMKRGANAIANLACDLPEVRSYTKLCLESIHCMADAVRLAK
jgi:hypothetical protein